MARRLSGLFSWTGCGAKRKRITAAPVRLPDVDTIEESANSHVKSYLQRYITDDKLIGYATLLDGKWGVGKTHFIKSFIDGVSSSDAVPFVYLSLFGIKTVSDQQIDLSAPCFLS